MRKTLTIALMFARRYAFARHSFNFIHVITLASIIGIAIGVCALVVVMSLFNGFRALAYSQLQQYDPHLRILPAQGIWLAGADTLALSIAQQNNIQMALPLIHSKVILQAGNTLTPAEIFSAEMPALLAMTNIIPSFVKREDNALLTKESCIIGIGIADRLGVLQGDELTITSPRALERTIMFGEIPRSTVIRVTHIFQTNNKEYDTQRLLIPRHIAESALSIPSGSASMIDIRCTSIAVAEAVRISLLRFMAERGQAVRIETWYDLHREFYDIMQFERLASFVVLSLIVLVAVFNVFASLSMTVTEKTPNIGLLRAVGANQSMIISIFFVESILVGCTGIGIGLFIGTGCVLGQQYFGWIQLNPSQYVVPTLPVQLLIGDLAWIIGMALILCILAGILPAQTAARILPSRALQQTES